VLLAGLATLAAACGSRTPDAQHALAGRARHPAAARRDPAPSVRLVHGPHDAPVPVLVYHVIGYSPGGSALEGLYVTPAEFRTQVAWLAANGFHAITLDAVLRYWLHRVTLPPKPVVLTFDDGYPGDWRYALPILRAHRWAAVLNLQIGNLVPLRVRQLIAAGWQIASHTFTHPDLTTVGAAQLRHEVLDSRFWIERVFHVPVDTFCYPYGHYDAAVVAEVRRAGYTAALTENPGRASPANGLLTLDRIRVGPTTGPAALAAAVG